MTGPRVTFALARDGLFPKYAGRVHPRRGTPAAAILTQGAIALTLLWGAELITGGTEAFAALLNFTGVGLSALSGLTVSTIFRLRARPGYAPAFRVPAYPIPPLVFVIATAWMVAYAVANQPLPSLMSLTAIAAAIPVYFAIRWMGRQGPERV
jgi:APA family basic amino acid/polyamine antiporter